MKIHILDQNTRSRMCANNRTIISHNSYPSYPSYKTLLPPLRENVFDGTHLVSYIGIIFLWAIGETSTTKWWNFPHRRTLFSPLLHLYIDRVTWWWWLWERDAKGSSGMRVSVHVLVPKTYRRQIIQGRKQNRSYILRSPHALPTIWFIHTSALITIDFWLCA